MGVKTSNLSSYESWFEKAREELVAEHFDDMSQFDIPVPVCQLPDGETLMLSSREGVPYLGVYDSEGRLNEVLGDSMDSPEESVENFFSSAPKVSERRKEFLLSKAKANWGMVCVCLENTLDERFTDVLREKGYTNTPPGPEVLIDFGVSSILQDDPSFFTDRDFYRLTRSVGGIDSPVVNSVKSVVANQTDGFYKSLYEEARLGRDEVEQLRAFNQEDIERRFSVKSYLKGWLDSRMENISNQSGGWAVEDIAKLAVWAENKPQMAPFVGPDLERWVKGVSKETGFSVQEINAERKALGGNVSVQRKRRPAIPKEYSFASKL